MTEDEAKMKFCPMFLITSNHSNDPALCIGSECMLFRCTLVEHQESLDKQAVLVKTYYCGIGGRP